MSEGITMNSADKAGKNYWDDNWSTGELPKPFDPNDQTLNNYVNLQLHKFFKELLNSRSGFDVLEVGCANSIWPIYFHRYFKANTYGLDYSEVGCERSRALLQHHGIPCDIRCGDLFSPPEDLTARFDLVVSFGVVEHFEHTAGCLKALSAFVKSGGLLVTIIPNMVGIVGRLQQLLDRSVYEVHIPLSREDLAQAHIEANLNLKSCAYFLPMNLSAVNSGAFATHPLNPLFRRLLSAISKCVWGIERYGLRVPPNRITSPYILAVASC